jgi:hypothetical protein
MIKPNEIRIGNLVSHFSRICDVFEIGEGGWLRINNDQLNTLASECDPVPITEDYLVRAGLKKLGTKISGSTCYCFGNWILSINENGKDFHLLNKFSSPQSLIYLTINYVHQFQNIYFTLIGEEVKFTEETK